MLPVLKKISIRKIKNEKGKSACTILAVFLTTILFIVIFSTIFFIKDALDEIARDSSSWIGDAAFIVTDEQGRAIENSNLVSETTYGLHVGEILDSGGYLDIELVSYQDKMAHWMKCYPTTGRMPQKENEIVVSEQYLQAQNLTYQEDAIIDVTYSVDGTTYTDSFILVGTYDRDIQSKNVMLLSDDFYNEVSNRLQEQGKNGRDVMYKLVEVIYQSSSNIEDTTNQLMSEIGFDEEQGFTVNNNVETGESFSASAYTVAGIFILFVMMIGYLFISNVFSISMNQDIKFYGKLVTNGVSDTEIKKMILFENHILFVIAELPALVAGYIFTSLTLPEILSSFFTFQVENRSNILIFILAVVFSYLTLLISSRKSINIAKKVSPMGMKHYMQRYKPVTKSDNKNCLLKFVMRRFHGDKKSAMKIYISIAFSIVLANLFYTIVTGFNEEEYISSNMAADYTVADTTFYSQTDDRERKNISVEDLKACNDLPGLIQSGGGARCGINIVMNDTQAQKYDKIVGDSNLNHPEPGNMYTYVYGLDDIMVSKMIVLEGEIDLESYRTGNYVIIDSLGEDGSTCFSIGETITIPYQNGNEKSYTVMAVAELPYEISFRSKWMGSSDLFLPYSEWSENTAMADYYMYTYDVEDGYEKWWDETLSQVVKQNPSFTYQSAKTIADDNKELIREIRMVGFVLSGILLCMGIMNFINCMTSSVYSRKKELAIMQSMGTTRMEIITALIKEGILYMAGGIVLGIIISIPCTRLAVDGFLILYCVHYQFYAFIYLLFTVIGIFIAVIVPVITYLHMDKKEPFLTRIKSCRE